MVLNIVAMANSNGSFRRSLLTAFMLLVMVDVVVVEGSTTNNLKSTLKSNKNQPQLLTIPLRKTDDDETRRRRHYYQRQLATSTLGKPQELASMYQDDGEHYIDMWCGSPKPQRQSLLVVTGVSPGISGFPCSDCVGECGKYTHIDKLYQDKQSKSFRVLDCNECLTGHCTSTSTGGSSSSNTGDNNQKCSSGMDYPSGDYWRGYEVTDKCYLGGPHDEPIILDKDWDGYDDIDFKKAAGLTFDFKFSCQTKITGIFNTFMADGILSMDSTKSSFWGQMYDAGRIPEQKFTLCYRKARAYNRTGTHAGAMTLGGADTRLHTHDMVMSIMDSTSSSNWKAKLRNIHLRSGGGGDSAKSTNAASIIRTLPLSENDFDASPIYVDSGYTNTFLSSNIATPFYDIWKELTGSTYSNYPKSMSEKERDSLPTILFQFVGDEIYNQEVLKKNGVVSANDVVGLAGKLDPDHPLDVIVAVPPSHYMTLTPGSENRFRASFYESAEREGSATVLGANLMRGHDILFNVDDQRFGWAESPCNYRDLVRQYYNGTHGDIPWSKKGGKGSKKKNSSSGKKGGGGYGGPFLFLLFVGCIAVAVIQGNNGRNIRAAGRAIYQDLPTGLELRARDDEQEIQFYEPPSAAY